MKTNRRKFISSVAAAVAVSPIVTSQASASGVTSVEAAQSLIDCKQAKAEFFGHSVSLVYKTGAFANPLRRTIGWKCEFEGRQYGTWMQLSDEACRNVSALSNSVELITACALLHLRDITGHASTLSDVTYRVSDRRSS